MPALELKNEEKRTELLKKITRINNNNTISRVF